MKYTIHRMVTAPPAEAGWDEAPWANLPSLSVEHFLAQSSDHRPVTEAKLAHDNEAVHVFFRVQDRWVRSVQTGLHVPVCTDSCAEFFVQPKADAGYQNFEINAGGAMLLFYIEDHTRTDNGFAKYTKITAEQAAMVDIRTSLPEVVEPEIPEPTTWTLKYSVPRELLEAYVGPTGDWSGQTWRGNFFKCGDKTSHPHWASWSPITGGEFNFHLPQYFGELELE